MRACLSAVVAGRRSTTRGGRRSICSASCCSACTCEYSEYSPVVPVGVSVCVPLELPVESQATWHVCSVVRGVYVSRDWSAGTLESILRHTREYSAYTGLPLLLQPRLPSRRPEPRRRGPDCSSACIWHFLIMMEWWEELGVDDDGLGGTGPLLGMTKGTWIQNTVRTCTHAQTHSMRPLLGMTGKRTWIQTYVRTCTHTHTHAHTHSTGLRQRRRVYIYMYIYI